MITCQVRHDSPVELPEPGLRELGELLEGGGAECGARAVVQRLHEGRVEGGGPLRAVRVVHLQNKVG